MSSKKKEYKVAAFGFAWGSHYCSQKEQSLDSGFERT